MNCKTTVKHFKYFLTLSVMKGAPSFIKVLLFLLSSFSCYAQTPVLHTIADKNEILIGDQFQLKVSADVDPDQFDITWLTIPDSMTHFELISKGKLDTVYTGSKLSGYAQNFIFTSFDSGKWTLPGFKITFVPKIGAAPVSLYSDSLPITVSYAIADSTNLLRDIKPIKEVEVGSNLIYYVSAIVLIIILLLVAYFLYKKWRNKNSKPTVISKIAAYETAMTALEQLKQMNLQTPEQVKLFHTRLALIYKQYLSSTYQQNYLTKTTDEVLIAMGNTPPSILSNTAAVLRCSDAVKFAKYLPDANENENSFQAIADAIKYIQQLFNNNKS